MFFLSNFWDKIGASIVEALRSLMLSICEIVYKLIDFFFDIFMMLGNASILTDETIQEFYSRIGLILGLFMIFRVMFSLIQYVINPDLLTDKSKGLFNIVKKVIIVIVLLGVTPSLFKYAFKAQSLIIDSNIIPKIITGQNIKTDDSGKELAWYAFSSFFHYDEFNEELFASYSSESFRTKCPYLNSSAMKNDFFENNTFRYAYNCVNATVDYTDQYGEESDLFVISFEGHGIVALIVGIVILWMILMYVIQVGIRVVQLGYLQLIAPVPIMMYLDPKGEDTFNKWVKQCITTYLDFFIRVAVIYLVLFIIQLLMNENSQHFVASLGVVTDTQLTWITIIMILALLIFAQKVLKLFKELFPGSGGAAAFDFGLNPKKVFNDTLAAGLIGGTVGALGAGASNAIHGYMNMRNAWKKNSVGGIKKWNELTSEERGNMTEKEYNAKRNKQLMEQRMKRYRATAAAGFKGAASVAGGVIGGAKAGLKTKDISKSGEAIKTANENREKRELRSSAGYKWYNPLPAMEDKILQFSGDRSADDIKNRQQALIDERKREKDLAEGERLYKTFSKPKAPGSTEMKLDIERAFKNAEYRKSYEALGAAKGEAKNADLVLSNEQARLNSAYNNVELHSSDETIKARAEKLLAEAKERYEIAYGNSKAMQGKLELAKAKHDGNKKIYVDDAKVEDLYKYYTDTHAQVKPLESTDDVVGTKNVDVNINDIINGEGPIDLSSTDLSKITAKLNEDLRKQEEALSEAMMAQRDAMAKNPFSEESKAAQSRAKEEEHKRDLIDESLSNLSQLLDDKSKDNHPEKLSRSERRRLENDRQKAEEAGNASEAARIEKILAEDDRLSE